MNAEFRDWLQNRVETYKLLARIFHHEADETLLSALRAMPQPAPTGFAPYDEGWKLIFAWLKAEEGKDQNAQIEDLAVDYARVFLGAGQVEAAAAYPFESVYTSPGRLVMQEAWEAVCREYEEAGYVRTLGSDLHEDHIALELGFLAKLGTEALDADTEEALVNAIARSMAFLKAHPMRWAAAFAEDIRRYAETDFYRGASRLLEGYLAADLELTGESLEEGFFSDED